MSLQILSQDLVGKQYLTHMWQDLLHTGEDPANGKWYENGANGDHVGLYGGLNDYLDQQPTFDQAHAKYIPQTSVGDQATTDNRNGLTPQATVTLGFDYQKGHTSSHSTTNSITVGVTEEVDINFEVADSKTTFSFSGTFSYTDGTEDSTVTTVSSSDQVPVNVPAGKVYLTVLTFTQEQLQVPYSMSVHVSGRTETWFESRVNGHYNYSYGAGPAFEAISHYGIAGADSSKYGQSSTGEGLVTLTGQVAIFEGGAYDVQTYDITDQYLIPLVPPGTDAEARAGTPAPGSATVGGGPDTLVLKVSQDHYLGDAQFTVSVGGQQVGGVLTAHALRSLGQTDAITVRGDWAAGVHEVSVEFLNDAWDGTPETDRNLHVESATFNGVAVPGAELSLFSAGAQGFAFEGTAGSDAPRIGIYRRLADEGGDFHATRYNDFIEGGAGRDRMFLYGGDDLAFGHGGDDWIEARDGGRNVLDGGEGGDYLEVISQKRFNELNGGAGDDLLAANAPSTVLRGGEGDDLFLLGPHARGSRILDVEGANQLAIAHDRPLSFERVGDDLLIHTDEDRDYDAAVDVIWNGFFAGGDNRVNGPTGEELLRLPEAMPRPLDEVDWEELKAAALGRLEATGVWSA